MSQLLVQEYLNQLHDLRKASGSARESVMREAFKDLLKAWGRSLGYVFVAEYEYTTRDKRTRYIDGALVHELRVPFGYWEAKDEKDDLDAEIETKFRRGYPQDNIIFEDSRQAVLIQNRQEVMRCATSKPEDLQRLLGLFFGYQRPEIAEFRKAIAQFKADLPQVLDALRERIETAQADNPTYRVAAATFLDHARATINPALTAADVREMLIQHVLTEEIFSKVFGDDEFHRQNNVAAKLYELEGTFFTGGVKRDTLKALEPYYAAIRAAAARISGHHEKQAFLKVVYEGFYKAYNPKAADRLGVVYTPNEIVRFMVQSADWLCEQHFGKRLIDKGVEILDPATGTGTFIVELIEHFRGQKDKLRAKYREELHANEMAILPYYVANLNIEATYATVMGEYEEFPNLCFVDTLDNIAWGRREGSKAPLGDLFGALSEENVARIKRQNARKISVIIGNPPYNANQQNENDNNKNRTYPAIDARIKQTYIAVSDAQKTKMYDMYIRFFRWASDRLGDQGVVAFITNRSFVDAAGADGFRATVSQEFSESYVIDLGGDYKKRGVGGGGNVFGIGTGVAISFWIRRPTRMREACRIHYCAAPMGSGESKLAWLANTRASSMVWKDVLPRVGYWIDHSERDEFATFLPIADRSTKVARVAAQERAIFKLYSLGISTNRDDWLYDSDKTVLSQKARLLVDAYASISTTTTEFPSSIKWSRNLKRRLGQGRRESINEKLIIPTAYRPYCRRWLYRSALFVDELGSADEMFPATTPGDTVCIAFSDPTSQKPWMVCVVSESVDLHYVGAGSGTVCIPHNVFADGHRLDNITDWALDRFRAHYTTSKRAITKDAILHYVYGVLHDPVYRETYAQDLKRSFPRIPFYPDFWRWAKWGEALMQLHLGYETVEPFPLRRIDVVDERAKDAGRTPKVVLRADREAGVIVLDSETQLSGVPAAAWRYVLGNRSALDWVLDQHKERTPKDPTVRARFNTYRFADHKERVVDLLMRVTRVSVETVAITEAMRGVAREG